ncbi:MAG TPA: LPS assembly lipoprotein LptE [Marinagarivorans sp.]
MPSTTPQPCSRLAPVLPLTGVRFVRLALVGIMSLCLCLSLASCGWQLRGFNKGQLPQQLALSTADPYAPIARQLQQTLVRRGVQITPNAPLTLWLDKEDLDKRTVAVTSIGAAAQYELHLNIDFSYTPKGTIPPFPTTLSAQRVFDFTPGTNLAKAEEEQTLIKEMRQELINRILLQSMYVNALEEAALTASSAANSASTAASASSTHAAH